LLSIIVALILFGKVFDNRSNHLCINELEFACVDLNCLRLEHFRIPTKHVEVQGAWHFG
jgi:hypothetical protein